MPLFQLLKVWHKDPSITNYDVRDLIEELQEWMDEGFLEADIWSTLKKRVNPALLPEQMKQETDASPPQVNEPRIKQMIIEKHSDGMKYFLINSTTKFFIQKNKGNVSSRIPEHVISRSAGWQTFKSTGDRNTD